MTEDLSTSRTCRLRNAGEAKIRELIVENLAALDRVVSFLEARRIYLYRISSNLIPFASHPVNTLAWWDEYQETFSRLALRLRNVGIRVSTHPGQYTVLNSPHPAIVRASVAELIYHARLLDALGADAAGKIVVHVGGLYAASKLDATARFTSTVAALPDAVRRRLVVENDDRVFDAEDALAVSRAAGIPAVFDWLHHQSNPCRRPIAGVLADIFDTWTSADGPPKVHLSSQSRFGPSGAHAKYVKVTDALAFLEIAPRVGFDCMLEAKQKDRALLRLRRELGAHGVVESAIAPRQRSRRGASSLQRQHGRS